MKLTLGQWLALPMASRVALLNRLPEQGFAAEARKAGARQAVCVDVEQVDIDEAEAALLLGCCLAEARQWLASASSFARYAMVKRLGLRQVRSQDIKGASSFTAPMPGPIQVDAVIVALRDAVALRPRQGSR
jgi:hypothetical protein